MDNYIPTTRDASTVQPVRLAVNTNTIEDIFTQETEFYKRVSPQMFLVFKNGEVAIKNKIDDTTTYTKILRQIIDLMFNQIREKIQNDDKILAEDKQKFFLKITVIDAVLIAAIKMIDLLEVKVDKFDFIFSIKGLANRSVAAFYSKL